MFREIQEWGRKVFGSRVILMFCTEKERRFLFLQNSCRLRIPLVCFPSKKFFSKDKINVLILLIVSASRVTRSLCLPCFLWCFGQSRCLVCSVIPSLAQHLSSERALDHERGHKWHYFSGIVILLHFCLSSQARDGKFPREHQSDMKCNRYHWLSRWHEGRFTGKRPTRMSCTWKSSLEFCYPFHFFPAKKKNMVLYERNSKFPLCLHILFALEKQRSVKMNYWINIRHLFTIVLNIRDILRDKSFLVFRV